MPQTAASSNEKITVYYDGACPSCVRDRKNFEKLAGRRAQQLSWFDISGQEQQLCQLGIDPRRALLELHIKDERQRIWSELDAYILLMRKVPLLRPLAWLIGLPLIRPLLARCYHRRVERRLNRAGRL